MGFFDQPLSQPIPKADLKTPKAIIEDLFGPQDFSGITFHYSNKGLRPWEAGATWGKEIRLQPAFKEKLQWRGAGRDEVLAHEIVHALRSDFNEPLFEEMLAFATSPKRKRLKRLFITRFDPWLFLTFGLISFFSLSFSLGALALFVLRAYLRELPFERCRKSLGLEKMLYLKDFDIKRMGSKAHIRRQGS